MSLSPLDEKLIYLLGCGLQTKEAAQILEVPEHTVENRLRRLRKLLGARTTTEVVACALSTGLIPKTHLMMNN